MSIIKKTANLQSFLIAFFYNTICLFDTYIAIYVLYFVKITKTADSEAGKESVDFNITKR